MKKYWGAFICLIGLSACDQIGLSKSSEKAFEEFEELVNYIDKNNAQSLRGFWMMEDCVLSEFFLQRYGRFHNRPAHFYIRATSADLSNVIRMEVDPWRPNNLIVIVGRGHSKVSSDARFSPADLDESYIDNIKTIYRADFAMDFLGNDDGKLNSFIKRSSGNEADRKVSFYHNYPNDTQEILDAFSTLVKACGGVVGN